MHKTSNKLNHDFNQVVQKTKVAAKTTARKYSPRIL